MQEFDFIVTGAGSAGRTAVETLIEERPHASILLIDTEAAMPYKRTHVSKHFGEGFALDDFAVHEKDWYSHKGIQLRCGRSVETIDPSSKQIRVNGEGIKYGKLLLATGAKQIIPCASMPQRGWSRIWTEQDGRNLHEVMQKHQRFIIIGMGVLGVEAAWQLVSAGKDVTLIGRNHLPMTHYLDSASAAILTEVLKREGVDLRPDCSVNQISASDTASVETSSGSISGDYIVIAAGSKPETRLAESAGIAVNSGIRVDAQMKTSQEDIWAAGDCAEHPDGRITGLWRSAQYQGQLAALSMLGNDVVHDNPPFRLKCEVFGGFWFSAGPVHAANDAEIFDNGQKLWRMVFVNDRLTALSGCGRLGLGRVQAKTAQRLILEGACRDTVCRELLWGE